MENNKDKVALTDDDLDKVSGGQAIEIMDSPGVPGSNGNRPRYIVTMGELPVVE